MKTLLKTALIVSAFTSLTSTAAINVTDSNSAVFNFGGSVDEMCKVKANASAGATSLLIDSSVKVQEIGTLEVWCNNGRAATTTYASANSGYLVNGKHRVAYTLDVGDIVSDALMSSTLKLSSTAAAGGINGETKAHTLKVRPIATGLEYAGEYSDTITVTVSYN